MGGEGGAICGGICIGICTLSILSAIPITMIVLGANHMGDCPMEPWIPKCMVIGGATTLALFVLIIIMMVCGAMENKGAVLCGTVLCVIIGLFLFAWQIASSYWVFKEWQGWDNVKNDIKRGCHKETYLFIFSVLIIYWVSVPCQGGGAKRRNGDSVA